MQRDDLVRLLHIAEALRATVGFIRGRRRADIDDDVMLRYALVQAVQIVGEAAGKVSAETRSRHPDIPWARMTGMRHRLVHAYFEVDHDILWTTVTEAAPDLLARISKLLPPE